MLDYYFALVTTLFMLFEDTSNLMCIHLEEVGKNDNDVWKQEEGNRDSNKCDMSSVSTRL